MLLSRSDLPIVCFWSIAPKCGFSRQAVELLLRENISFGSFNILADESVRQGLKKHSNWPTYPQIYVNGELIGGLDILKETSEEGSLTEQWGLSNAASVVTPLHDRLASLVKRSDVMVSKSFMLCQGRGEMHVTKM